MDDKLRDHLRLMLGIKLTMLPRWVKHDFWRQAEPQNGRAKEKMVDEIISVIDETMEVAAKDRQPAVGNRISGLDGHGTN